MKRSALINRLIEDFKVIPGVGSKSAQRMAYYFLEKNRKAALALSRSLREAVERVDYCQRCRLLTEDRLCEVCADDSRDRSLLCIVENPADVYAIESSHSYRGLYFVLMGSLSPIDGIGPEQLGFDLLRSLCLQEELEEVILATSTTVSGEATANYIADMLADTKIKISRIAHGVPLGGELEYIDGTTLGHALAGRRSFAD